MATFQVDPESCNVHDQSDDSNDEEFDLQVRGNDFQ